MQAARRAGAAERHRLGAVVSRQLLQHGPTALLRRVAACSGRRSRQCCWRQGRHCAVSHTSQRSPAAGLPARPAPGFWPTFITRGTACLHCVARSSCLVCTPWLVQRRAGGGGGGGRPSHLHIYAPWRLIRPAGFAFRCPCMLPLFALLALCLTAAPLCPLLSLLHSIHQVARLCNLGGTNGTRSAAV